uniref:C3H1-type domain-containing protein n=1 Tax=Chromera velia CCMP2878 TaxID=1169474 RepID=A0A0G4GIE4_9ALVE|eukprot:Cvel_22046.t1-p1 / transcript=Cvel_22046.t1 / gene=Cvel_22046 / organism=Chromera_velia_CCMP2878 / gene_product=Zinc finger CCCH domain-containing protein 14, putative / transcript_product=Zinc finger CCCH domain-containing protein 14, putative / location=Cvel_scaffold2129:11862-17954(-) / protein_length=715 / sequence_SO=supercontig / SO=protein_coding / is_pseudo=false
MVIQVENHFAEIQGQLQTILPNKNVQVLTEYICALYGEKRAFTRSDMKDALAEFLEDDQATPFVDWFFGTLVNSSQASQSQKPQPPLSPSRGHQAEIPQYRQGPEECVEGKATVNGFGDGTRHEYGKHFEHDTRFTEHDTQADKEDHGNQGGGLRSVAMNSAGDWQTVAQQHVMPGGTMRAGAPSFEVQQQKQPEPSGDVSMGVHAEGLRAPAPAPAPQRRSPRRMPQRDGGRGPRAGGLFGSVIRDLRSERKGGDTEMADASGAGAEGDRKQDRKRSAPHGGNSWERIEVSEGHEDQWPEAPGVFVVKPKAKPAILLVPRAQRDDQPHTPVHGGGNGPAPARSSDSSKKARHEASNSPPSRPLPPSAGGHALHAAAEAAAKMCREQSGFNQRAADEKRGGRPIVLTPASAVQGSGDSWTSGSAPGPAQPSQQWHARQQQQQYEQWYAQQKQETSGTTHKGGVVLKTQRQVTAEFLRAQLMEQWANGPAAASSSSSSKNLGGGAGGFSKPKRCRFWPRCTKGDDCPFIHPRELCKNWPQCSFGNECFYIHPQLPCKFGKDCSNAHCNFSHEAGWDAKKNYQAFLAKKAANKGGLGAAASGGEGAGATDDSLVFVPNKDDDDEEEETHAEKQAAEGAPAEDPSGAGAGGDSGWVLPPPDSVYQQGGEDGGRKTNIVGMRKEDYLKLYGFTPQGASSGGSSLNQSLNMSGTNPPPHT